MLGIWLRFFSLGCDWSCDDRQQHKNVVTWDFAGGWRSVRFGLKTWRKVKGIKAKTIHQNVLLSKGQDKIRYYMRNHLRQGGLGWGIIALEITHLAVEHGFRKMALYMLLLCSDLLNKAISRLVKQLVILYLPIMSFQTCDLLSSVKDKIRYFKECSCCSFPHNKSE